MVTRGGAGLGTAAVSATRLPSGHPEGYIEAFAQIYSDVAELIGAVTERKASGAGALLVPTVADGLRGVRFIHAAVESSQRNAAWTAV
jgi:hypothetical protein